jgi:hypothetical protein
MRSQEAATELRVGVRLERYSLYNVGDENHFAFGRKKFAGLYD